MNFEARLSQSTYCCPGRPHYSGLRDDEADSVIDRVRGFLKAEASGQSGRQPCNCVDRESFIACGGRMAGPAPVLAGLPSAPARIASSTAMPKILYLVTEDWFFVSHFLPM